MQNLWIIVGFFFLKDKILSTRPVIFFVLQVIVLDHLENCADI